MYGNVEPVDGLISGLARCNESLVVEELVESVTTGRNESISQLAASEYALSGTD